MIFGQSFVVGFDQTYSPLAQQNHCHSICGTSEKHATKHHLNKLLIGWYMFDSYALNQDHSKTNNSNPQLLKMCWMPVICLRKKVNLQTHHTTRTPACKMGVSVSSGGVIFACSSSARAWSSCHLTKKTEVDREFFRNKQASGKQSSTYPPGS